MLHLLTSERSFSAVPQNFPEIKQPRKPDFKKALDI